MPYEISVAADQTYIKLRRWGKVSEEEMKKSLKELQTLAKNEKINRVLVDGSEVEFELNSHQLFQFGEAISQTFSSIRLWFAVIFGDKSKEDLKFLETIIHNRTKNSAIFADEQSALDWLKSKK